MLPTKSELDFVETRNITADPQVLQSGAKQSAAWVLWYLELRRLAHQSSDEEFWRTLVYNRDSQLRPAPRSLGDSFSCCYLNHVLEIRACVAGSQYTPIMKYWLLQSFKAGTPYKDAWANLSYQRFFFVSENGRIGWVPITARAGDQLYVFKGMRVPVVLRPIGDLGWWQLIGACYIHGLMDGEAEDMAQGRWEHVKIR